MSTQPINQTFSNPLKEKNRMARQNTSLLLSALAASAIIGSASAAPVIYEPFEFADGDTSLNGNAGGTGLSGNWTNSRTVEDTNMTYGNLETSGDAIFINGGWTNGNPNIAVDTTSAYTGLLADGGEMWISVLFETTASDQRSMLALTSDGPGLSNGNIDSSGVGVAIARTSNGNFYANIYADDENGSWGNNLSSTPSSAAGASAQNNAGAINTTYFLVAHVQWGDTAADLDQIDLYLPGTDLDLTGHLVATSTGIIANQGVLDNLGFTNLRNGTTWDEVRIGATYADVSPIPEPGSLALIGLGGLLIARRRRA